VADAYELPYADSSVDGVYCIAVLEHLEFPDQAVRDIARVLKSGGEALFETPLMQYYHAYPDHFQNFTVSGQTRLVGRHGLTIVSAGTGVGPSYTLWHMAVSYISMYWKPSWRWTLSPILIRLIRSRDKIINEHPDSHVMASTTYVRARKP
jgi:SAM-dependent methyltransferase